MTGRKIVLAAWISASLPLVSGAAGFNIFESGAKATGMGGAFTATADDPSAMFYNPAGLAFQKRSKITLGGTLIAPFTDFKGANPFPGDGVSEEGERMVFFPPGLYYAHAMSDRLVFGVGAFTDFGLSTGWKEPDTYSGRFISTKADLKSISLQPTVAYKLSEKLGVGFGLELRTSNVALKRNQPFINPFSGKVIDVAKIDLQSDWKMTAGFSAGLLAKPVDNWSVGFSYRHSIKTDYDGTSSITFIPTGNSALDELLKARLPIGSHPVRTSIEFPKMVSFGIATTAIDRWTLELDVNWTGWSSFDTLVIEFSDLGTRQTIEEHWEDVFNYRLGVERRINEKLALRGGYLFDASPQPVAAVGPLLPDSDRHGVNIGIGYTVGNWTTDVTGFIAFLEKRSTVVDGVPTSRDGYNGTYKTLGVLLSFAVTYGF